MPRTLLATVLLLATWFPLLAQPTDESPAAAAARMRQQAIQSIEVRYHLKEVIEPRGRPDLLNPKAGAKLFPTERTVFESDNRIVLRGSDIRIEQNHPIQLLPAGTFLPTKSVGVIHDDEAKSYSILANGDVRRDNSDATIKPRRSASVGNEMTLLPFNLHCRGFAPALGGYSFADGHWQPTGIVQSINGTLLEQYRLHRPQTADRVVVGWADPKQDYAIRRVRVDDPKLFSYLIEAAFETDVETGLVLPKGWTYTRYDTKGNLLLTHEYRITSRRVNYSPDSSEFELTFPPNVLVYNQFENSYSLVREDGTFQLLNSPSDDGKGDRSWWQRSRWVVFGAGSVVSVVAFFSFRARRLRRRDL